MSYKTTNSSFFSFFSFKGAAGLMVCFWLVWSYSLLVFFLICETVFGFLLL